MIARLLSVVLGLLVLANPVWAQTSADSATAQSVADVQMPLVTAGTFLRWASPEDQTFFDLPATSWIKLSIYSAGIDFSEVGDEIYGQGPLEAVFGLAKDDETLTEKRYSMSPSGWTVLYEGPADEGRYLIESRLYGDGKNVYFLKLETEFTDVDLKAYSITVNASETTWQDALSFQTPPRTPCRLDLYDGDGPEELEAQLVLPSGYVQDMLVSRDREAATQHLPRMPGEYKVQLRLPENRYQKTNSVRFSVYCDGVNQLTPLLPAETLIAPDPGAIQVYVFDTTGKAVDIPYDITGRFDRTVRLRPDAAVQLRDVRVSNGERRGSDASFGFEGGTVVFIVEQLTQVLPRPEVQVVVTMPEEALQALSISPTINVVPLIPIPAPEFSVAVQVAVEVPPSPAAKPNFLLERMAESYTLIACQSITVTLVVQNTGDAPGSYTLRETIPLGLTVYDADLTEQRELIWQGTLAPGEKINYHYRLEPLADAANSTLEAVLESDSQKVQSEAQVQVATLQLEASAFSNVYVGDEAATTVTVHNPLAEPLTVYLKVEGSSRVVPIDLQKRLDLPVLGQASTELRVHAKRAGRAQLRVTPYSCDDEDATPAGPTRLEPLEVFDVTPLPESRQITTLSTSISVHDLPVLDTLYYVIVLPEDASYVSGSASLDAQPLKDPERAGQALVFELPTRQGGLLSFEVLHAAALLVSEADSSLIALTPSPELLWGDERALGFLRDARPIDAEETVSLRERIGAVILEPANGTALRNRDRISVRVDTPLRDSVTLYINGLVVDSETIGERTYDEGLQRQTFEYVGVPLKVGPNELKLMSVAQDREIFEDSVTVYFAGTPASFSAAALTPLVADSAEPLAIELSVEDAWSNAPLDGFVTLEVEGAVPAEEDASSERVGFQIRMSGGKAVLLLEPLDKPGTVTIHLLTENGFYTETLTVGSDLRPWVVTGVGSVGVSYGENSLDFGVSASVFARGRIFDDYLLSLGLTYPFGNLGSPDDAVKEQFGIAGTSAPISFDAESRHGVYFRLERDLNYLQYGDFTTHLDGELLDFGRRYTGVSTLYEAYGFGLKAYAAYEPSDKDVVYELKSDGTSLHFLPDTALEPASLRIRVVKKDALGRVIADDDPRTRDLAPLLDFRVDEELGLVELFRPIPLTDGNGNDYYLQFSYRLRGGNEKRFLHYGAQLEADLDVLKLRAGLSQEKGSDVSAQVIAAGASLAAGPLDADLEVAYGSTEESGGLGAAARLTYEDSRLLAEANWQYLSEEYRSPSVTEAKGGHTVSADISYAIIPEVSVSVGATLVQKEDTLSYTADALATYLEEGFDVQFGLNIDKESLRPLLGLNLYDVAGWTGSRFGIVHRQGVGSEAQSQTSFSVALPILENLSFTITDELIWGNSNTILIGLESSLDHNRMATTVCRTLGCKLIDPTLRLGTTVLRAQYDIPGGTAVTAGRVRLGLESNYPVTEHLSLELGAERVQDLTSSSQTETALRLGAQYSDDDVQASARYELNWNEARLKQNATAGLNFAVSEKLYSRITGTYVYEPGRTGLEFGVSAAYRGDILSVLADNKLELGVFGRTGSALTGDNRMDLAVTEYARLRAGYAYRWRFDSNYLDLINLGASFDLWEGGALLTHGRLFNDWTTGEHALGAGFELSQRLGCGVYGVAGYNYGGLERDYGAIYNGEGAFLRLDVVVDEQWHCGKASLSGKLFQDNNANGGYDETDLGKGAIKLELYSQAGELVASTLTRQNGDYTFSRLTPGSYTLRLDSAELYGGETADLTYTVTLGFGEQKHYEVALQKPEDQP